MDNFYSAAITMVSVVRKIAKQGVTDVEDPDIVSIANQFHTRARACSSVPSLDLKLAKWLKFGCIRACIMIPLENRSTAAYWILEWFAMSYWDFYDELQYY
ncbi:hypothetical protein SDJN03_19437, partial [Cucurbita argyrosperma subsp. sororia]